MNYRLLLVCFFIFNMNLDCNEDCETKIRDLVNKWEHYDGEEFQPLSLKLSNSLLECDSIFFKIFQNKDEAYKEWISSLQGGTFTVYDFENSNDSIAQRKKLISLKNEMIKKCKKLNNNKSYNRESKILLKFLRKIKIRYID